MIACIHILSYSRNTFATGSLCRLRDQAAKGNAVEEVVD